MNINALNKRITFYKNFETENEYLQTVQEPIFYKTVWASITPMSGKEYLEAQRIRSELTYKIYTRYFSDLTCDMIINYKGKKFQIISIINNRENNEMLQFVCTEKVGDVIV